MSRTAVDMMVSGVLLVTLGLKTMVFGRGADPAAELRDWVDRTTGDRG